MRAFLLGTAEDVRGFALAGVAGRACADAAETERAALELKARKDLSLVLLSKEVAAAWPQAAALLEGEHGPPAVVVLP